MAAEFSQRIQNFRPQQPGSTPLIDKGSRKFASGAVSAAIPSMSFFSHELPISFWQNLLLGLSGLCFVGSVWTAFPRVAGVFDSWRRVQGISTRRGVEQSKDFKVEVRPNLDHFVPKEITCDSQKIR
jgi:hypothetical protein